MKLIILLLGWIQLPYIDRYRISHDNFGIDVIILHTHYEFIHNDLEIEGEMIDNWSP
jgi:hypothetical protein